MTIITNHETQPSKSEACLWLDSRLLTAAQAGPWVPLYHTPRLLASSWQVTTSFRAGIPRVQPGTHSFGVFRFSCAGFRWRWPLQKGATRQGLQERTMVGWSRDPTFCLCYMPMCFAHGENHVDFTEVAVEHGPSEWSATASSTHVLPSLSTSSGNWWIPTTDAIGHNFGRCWYCLRSNLYGQ